MIVFILCYCYRRIPVIDAKYSVPYTTHMQLQIFAVMNKMQSETADFNPGAAT